MHEMQRFRERPTPIRIRSFCAVPEACERCDVRVGTIATDAMPATICCEHTHTLTKHTHYIIEHIYIIAA